MDEVRPYEASYRNCSGSSAVREACEVFIERKINSTIQVVELWKCNWVNSSGTTNEEAVLEKSYSAAKDHPARRI
jgi:hypothetical protein